MKDNFSGNVYCLGSCIMDFTVRIERFPLKGETLYSDEECIVILGGKGLNQAIAAKKGGAHTYIIANLSNDEYGNKFLKFFRNYGIDVSMVTVGKQYKTGIAMIWLNSDGDNMIVCSPGSNSHIEKEILVENINFSHKDILLSTLEFDKEFLIELFKKAKEQDAFIIVDPSSRNYSKLDTNIMKYIDITKPNEVEMELITGIKPDTTENIQKALHKLKDMGVTYPLVSLGDRGVHYILHEEVISKNIVKTEVVDTTAAGDVFIGTLASRLSQNISFNNAIEYALHASSYCVSHLGASTSIPSKEQLIEYFGRKV